VDLELAVMSFDFFLLHEVLRNKAIIYILSTLASEISSLKTPHETRHLHHRPETITSIKYCVTSRKPLSYRSSIWKLRCWVYKIFSGFPL